MGDVSIAVGCQKGRRWKSVESSHVGVAGSPSRVWEAWNAVAELATRTELIALTRHASPVVRGYAVKHLARNEQLDDATWNAWLEAALRDTTTVRTLDGCMMAEQSIADMVREQLCWNAKDKAGARMLLARIGRAC